MKRFFVILCSFLMKCWELMMEYRFLPLIILNKNGGNYIVTPKITAMVVRRPTARASHPP